MPEAATPIPHFPSLPERYQLEHTTGTNWDRITLRSYLEAHRRSGSSHCEVHPGVVLMLLDHWEDNHHDDGA